MTCCCRALRGVFSQTINFGQDFLQNEYPKGQWGIAWVAISWIAICLAPFYYASELARRPFEINASPETKTNFQPVPLRHPPHYHRPLKRTYGLL